jgi:hypothetical protein
MAAWRTVMADIPFVDPKYSAHTYRGDFLIVSSDWSPADPSLPAATATAGDGSRIPQESELDTGMEMEFEPEPVWEAQRTLFFVKKRIFSAKTLEIMLDPKRKLDERLEIYTVDASAGMVRLMLDIITAKKQFVFKALA